MNLGDLKNRFSRQQPPSADPAHAYGSEAEIMAEFRQQEYAQPAPQRGGVLSSLRERLAAERPPRENNAPTYSADTYYQEEAPDLGWEDAFAPPEETAPAMSAQERFDAFRSEVYSAPARQQPRRLHYDYDAMYAPQPDPYTPYGYGEPYAPYAPTQGYAPESYGYGEPYGTPDPYGYVPDDRGYAPYGAETPYYDGGCAPASYGGEYYPRPPYAGQSSAAPLYEDLGAPAERTAPRARAVFEEIPYPGQRPSPAPRQSAPEPGPETAQPVYAPPAPEDVPAPPTAAVFRSDPVGGDVPPLEGDVPYTEGPAPVPGQASSVSNAPRMRRPESDAKYLLWSGSIIAGVLLTVFSFIYACTL